MTQVAAEQRRGLVEAFKGRDPRLFLFYFVIAAGLLILAGGMVYQQLLQQGVAREKEITQSQIRVVVPGPRGNIYDRDGRLLVGNRPRFAVVLNLDELRREFRREFIDVRKAYRAADDEDLPTEVEMSHIARHSVVNRYLQQINRALARDATLDPVSLRRHFLAERLLPYTLIDDLQPEEYARLLEQLPVNSPLQVYVTSTRHYPYKSAAAHALGYVSVEDDIDVGESFPGAGLTTVKMKGSTGKDGLEARFDEQLQGEAGGTIYRLDPGRYRVAALEKRLPIQGNNVVTSLDIDLQLAAEKQMEATEMKGAAVMLDVNTGEVLVLASKPDYDLNAFSPRLSSATAKDINDRGAWLNRAVAGSYPPGSSFKVPVTIAGMRAGVIHPDSKVVCTGHFRVGNRVTVCNNHTDRGEVDLRKAIAKSCNTFFYHYGLEMGPEVIAEEARRLHFGQRTGIELPHETRWTLVPDPAWKRRTRGEVWTGGDTTNFSIGQGDMLVTPLQMAAFTASLARGQVHTTPTMIHLPDRPLQRSASLGLSHELHAALLAGMEECTVSGSARSAFNIPRLKIPNLRVAGKTGTAQAFPGGVKLNFAWFICFAPIENPQVAIAIVLEGGPGEETGGGTYAAPVAQAMLRAWVEKQQRGPGPRIAAH